MGRKPRADSGVLAGPGASRRLRVLAWVSLGVALGVGCVAAVWTADPLIEVALFGVLLAVPVIPATLMLVRAVAGRTRREVARFTAAGNFVLLFLFTIAALPELLQIVDREQATVSTWCWLGAMVFWLLALLLTGWFTRDACPDVFERRETV